MKFQHQRIRDPLHNLIEFGANQFEHQLWKVIQTRPFQRLRRVKQLGFSDFVYPGATHSRFAHSLGVFHTARRLMRVIKRHLGEEGYETKHANAANAAAIVHDLGPRPLRRIICVKQLGFADFGYPVATHARFAHSLGVFHTARRLMRVIKRQLGEEGYETTHANAAIAAALVHDLGHGPFSHAFEDVGRRLDLKLTRHELMSDLLIREGEVSEALNGLVSGFANDVASIVKNGGTDI